MAKELKELAQLLMSMQVISVNRYGRYTVIQQGDDLDPTYNILDNLEPVDTGSNGFSDGYIFSPEELLNNYLKAF